MMLRIRGCGLPVEQVDSYIKSVNLGAMESLRSQRDLDDAFVQLDNAANTAVVDAMSKKYLSTKIDLVQRQVREGNGRMAIKPINKLMRFNGIVLAKRAFEGSKTLSALHLKAAEGPRRRLGVGVASPGAPPGKGAEARAPGPGRHG